MELKTGWWLTYPSEKYESQLGLFFSIYVKIKMFQTTNQISNVVFSCSCSLQPILGLISQNASPVSWDINRGLAATARLSSKTSQPFWLNDIDVSHVHI